MEFGLGTATMAELMESMKTAAKTQNGIELVEQPIAGPKAVLVLKEL